DEWGEDFPPPYAAGEARAASNCKWLLPPGCVPQMIAEQQPTALDDSPAHRASIQPGALLTIPAERPDETSQPRYAETPAATALARSGNENPAGGPGLGNPRSLGTAFVLNFQVLALLGE